MSSRRARKSYRSWRRINSYNAAYCMNATLAKQAAERRAS